MDWLSDRKTQIIPLELMAAAGMLYTYQDKLRGKDIIFFIDNQSVRCALVKRLQPLLGHPAACYILAAAVPADRM